MDAIALPPALVDQARKWWGQAGLDWGARAPAIIAECVEQWSLTLGEPFPNLSFSFVAPATLPDGRRCVFKIGYPAPDRENITEMDALRLYDGRGCVRLLASDEARVAVLLERLEPGYTAEALQDEEAMPIAAGLMRQLWRPVPAVHRYPAMAKLLANMEHGAADLRDPYAKGWIDRALAMAAELQASEHEQVVLHRDLHQGNILRASDGWLAIDPKGVTGQPGSDVWCMLCNPFERVQSAPDMARLMARRLDILAEAMAMDRAWLQAWAVVGAVLSGWWSYKPGAGMDWRQEFACAEALAAA